MSKHAHGHGHGHGHMGEADWERMAALTELEGELLLAYVTDTAAWVTELRGDAPPVRHIVDIGSGPGVGTCELARVFPEADVVAVDGSPAMLERARRRAVAQGLDARVSTHQAELPNGLDGLGPADLIWASMSLHHVGAEVAVLRLLRAVLGRDGVISVQSADLPSMLTAAGFDVLGSRIARVRFDPPVPDVARQVALGRLRRTREELGDGLDGDDLHTLDVLVDPDDARRDAPRRRGRRFVASDRDRPPDRGVTLSRGRRPCARPSRGSPSLRSRSGCRRNR